MTEPAPKSGSTLYGIQVLRGIAALMVVLFHARYMVGSTTIEQAFRNGAAGVDVFFVISGVVMALTAPALAPTTFLWKRIARIVPLYWFFSMLKLMTMLVLDVSNREIPLEPGYVLSTFLFIPAYDGEGGVFPIIKAGWTLNFEMYFYLVCALALAVNRARFAVITSAVVGIGTIAGSLLLATQGTDVPAILTILAPISLEFVGGIALVALWRRGLKIPLWGCFLLVALSLAALAAAPLMEQFDLIRPLVWGLPALGLVCAVLALEPQVRFDRWKPLVLLGDASYALYLAHTATLPIAFRIVKHFIDQPLVVFVTIVLASVASGIVVHLLVERPLNSLVRRGSAWWKAALAGQASPA